MMDRCTIIDTHLHAVSPDQVKYPRLSSELPGSSWVDEAPVSAEGLVAEMDQAGVTAGVLVQPVGAYGTDNSYVADATAELRGADGSSKPNHPAPQRLAAACVIDMTASDRLEQLRHWTQQRGIGGVRLFSIPTPNQAWLDDPATYPVWEACAEWGVRVSVALLPPELPQLGRMLSRFPEVPVALDHCGFIDLGDHPPPQNLAQLCELAPLPNLYLKVTTHVLNWARAQSPDLLATLHQTFGADRLMWGSDYPQSHDRTYAQAVEFAQQEAQALPQPSRAKLLGETALTFWPELA